jgi:hypothetical protein
MTLRINPRMNATVHAYSPIDHRHTSSGEWETSWGEEFAMNDITQVAICALPNEPAINLLCLNRDGDVIFDSEHPTIEEAKTYAELEYRGLRDTWQTVKG